MFELLITANNKQPKRNDGLAISVEDIGIEVDLKIRIQSRGLAIATLVAGAGYLLYTLV
ncbi:hypothetical protein KFU94_00525 [Chloroflexi bacterium TSY]|nr:hypothetical protein [Chloroflexi bacterium TSY]